MVKFSELYRLLEAHGWERKGRKRHDKYVHPDKAFFIPVGRHTSKEVPTGTLHSILRKAGIDESC